MTNPISEKEIADLETTIQKKSGENRTQRSKLLKAFELVTSIKMLPRIEVIEKAIPAKPGIPAVRDEKTGAIVKKEVLAIPGRAETTKTIFDIMPPDTSIPGTTLDHTRRKQIFDASKKQIESL